MNKIITTLCGKKFWIELLVMTVAMTIASAAVYYFLVPSKLIIGSISGLSIVLSALTGDTVSVPAMIFIINAILLVLAYFLIGKEFGAKTVYTALIVSPIIKLLDHFLPWQSLVEPGATSVMGDPWFDLLCFVLLLSASQAVLFSINASTGGLDILAKIINKYLHFDIGKSVSVAGAAICCTAFAINPFRMVVIGLIGTWINGIVVDYFSTMLNNKKRVCVVSHDYEIIRQYIINELHRGCTLYDVIGGYSNEHSVELESLLSKDEFARLMSFINNNNINAFITAGNVSEVYGFWNNNRKGRKAHAESR